jgi:CRP-like cAMP-binding protein
MPDFFSSDIKSLVSPPLYSAILRRLTLLDLQEGEQILGPGQLQDNLYFIKKGVARSFTRSFSTEWTNWFAAEGNAVYSAESLLNNSPSPECIETCTPCQLFRIARQDYNLLLAEFPELYQLAFQIANKHLIVAEKRMYGLHMLTAYERYEQFIQTHQHIANRVKMQHIASYLGMTPTHLSRIRRDFATNNRQKFRIN